MKIFLKKFSFYLKFSKISPTGFHPKKILQSTVCKIQQKEISMNRQIDCRLFDFISYTPWRTQNSLKRRSENSEDFF